MYYSNSQAIIDVENLLRDASTLIQRQPQNAISLSREALELSIESEFKIGVAKSKLSLLQANLFKGDMGTALKLSKECLLIFNEKIDIPFEYAELLRYLGMIHYKLHNYNLSLDFTKKSLKRYKKLKDKRSVAKSLDLLGNIHSRKQEYPEAFSYYKECLDLKKKINNNPENISVSLINIGLLFLDLSDYEKSKGYTKEAKQLLKGSKSSYLISVSLQNLGIAYGRLGRLKKAIGLLIKSLKISQKSQMQSTEASVLSNLGEFCFYSGKINDSIKYASKGIKICEILGLRNNIYATCLVTIFRCHHAQGELEVAVEIGKECMSLCKDVGDNILAIDLFKELVEVLEKMNRIGEALMVSKELLNLQTDIYTRKRDFSVFKIQSRLEVEMKEQQLKLQSELIKQQEKHNNELTVVNEELDRFVGIASHDLKEPIRTIDSFSEILGRYISKETEEYEFLEYIQKASKRMGFLIDDLLSFARAGKLTQAAAPVDLMKVMVTIEEDMHMAIRTSHTILKYRNLPTIHAHETPIIQLFQNIIANSIKYTKVGIPPIIEINYEKNEEGLTFMVADNGMGIEESKVDMIFDPFIRVHGKTDKKGSGIGLATCRRIVERYKGKIWATSKFNIGTKIHFFIPNTNCISDN